ncbi:MAG: tRNA (adenosine(37)-N6)-threonylcarbamoyltransferase complex ATPase subunit type 1 TsaE [Clostridiales Family XIII bacterium]|jgi:tRNA threonylcarbamoyladenosine biosynthesis protein TsaE|nr:tRNA (adenosine(37)-N6)-threonylcarbamoyltransferase complex ATPase subunit type 1 TsaE [Clostridiales Family XIII bacterium]
MERLLKDEAEIRALGLALAAKARPGTVIALIGDLGTGKTTLAKAIAEGLGVTESVTSPTFAIIKEYASGRLPFHHFDAYRLGSPEEMYALGFEEYFCGDGVTVVEWANLVEEFLPKDAMVIDIAYGQNAGERRVRVKGIGDADASV